MIGKSRNDFSVLFTKFYYTSMQLLSVRDSTETNCEVDIAITAQKINVVFIVVFGVEFGFAFRTNVFPF